MTVGSINLLQYLDMDILFKIFIGSVVLLHHLDMEISFKTSVGSMIMRQIS